jgi:hypothetical protein
MGFCARASFHRRKSFKAEGGDFAIFPQTPTFLKKSHADFRKY